MARGSNFWLGMIVGAAAGAVSALLYAPKRGDEMRSDVRHAANRAGTKAKDVWSDTKEQATKVAGTVADRSKQVVERGRGMVEGGTSRMREAVTSGREAAAEKRKQLEHEKEAREEQVAESIGT